MAQMRASRGRRHRRRHGIAWAVVAASRRCINASCGARRASHALRGARILRCLFHGIFARIRKREIASSLRVSLRQAHPLCSASARCAAHLFFASLYAHHAHHQTHARRGCLEIIDIYHLQHCGEEKAQHEITKQQQHITCAYPRSSINK